MAKLNRRLILGFLLLNLGFGAQSAIAEHSQSIPGLYWMQISEETGAVFEAVVSMGRNGTYTAATNVDDLIGFSPEIGAWERIGRREIEITHGFWQHGFGLIVIRGSAEVGNGEFAGTYTCEAFPAGFDPTVDDGFACPGGTLLAKRLD